MSTSSALEPVAGAAGPGAADDRRDDPRYQRLVAATRAAAVQGYDAVSMRELAATTRMSLSTVYRYFASKDHLIAEAHADGMEGFRSQLSSRQPRGATAEDRVSGVMGGMVRALEHDEVRTRTLMRALYSLEPGVGRSRESVRDTYQAMIDTAIGDEQVPDRAAAIETLGHVIDSAILDWMNRGRDATHVRRVLEQAVHLLVGRSVRSGA
jgi:AcrR family transcriptional regulator